MYLFSRLTFIVLLQKSCEANCVLFQQLQVETVQALRCWSLVCILNFVWLIRCSKICRINWVNLNQISKALRFDNVLNPIAKFLAFVSTWSQIISLFFRTKWLNCNQLHRPRSIQELQVLRLVQKHWHQQYSAFSDCIMFNDDCLDLSQDELKRHEK